MLFHNFDRELAVKAPLPSTPEEVSNTRTRIHAWHAADEFELYRFCKVLLENFRVLTKQANQQLAEAFSSSVQTALQVR
jgi:hypothetical protein